MSLGKEKHTQKPLDKNAGKTRGQMKNLSMATFLLFAVFQADCFPSIASSAEISKTLIC